MNARYGVDYSTQLPSTHEKSHQTNMRKRGVKFAVQSSEVREKINKKVKEKYGVNNVFQLETVKEKIKQTNIEKYGVPNPGQIKCTSCDRKKSITSPKTFHTAIESKKTDYFLQRSNKEELYEGIKNVIYAQKWTWSRKNESYKQSILKVMSL